MCQPVDTSVTRICHLIKQYEPAITAVQLDGCSVVAFVDALQSVCSLLACASSVSSVSYC